MGSFQVTYDDFSGGHYLGNRVAKEPANTWFGENMLLNGQGELIPGRVQYSTLAAPSVTSPYTVWTNKYNNGLFKYGNVAYGLHTFTYEASGAVLAAKLQLVYVNYQSVTGTTSVSSIAISSSRSCIGSAVSVRVGSSDFIYFVDRGSGRICSCDLSGGITDISSALSGTGIKSVEVYKSRMLAWSNTGIRLYYSDPTFASWSTADYYDFPGLIQSVIPRSNDLLVVTTAGVYSVTGVLGETTNIQLILPYQNQSTAMATAKANGRSAVFVDNEYLYELLGGSTAVVARFNQSDINATRKFRGAESVNTYYSAINVEAKGAACIFLDSGVLYAQKQDGTFVRMFVDTLVENHYPMVAGPGYAQTALPQSRNTFVLCSDLVSGTQTVGATYGIYYQYDGESPALASSTAIATGTATLAEYWHKSPMSVKEVIVEAVYDTPQTLGSSASMANPNVSATIIPSGVVDMTVTQTPTLASSTQTYTTTTSDITVDDTRVIHRFRIDNAPKGYGFSPKITAAGCRIRRVVCVCED